MIFQAQETVLQATTPPPAVIPNCQATAALAAALAALHAAQRPEAQVEALEAPGFREVREADMPQV